MTPHGTSLRCPSDTREWLLAYAVRLQYAYDTISTPFGRGLGEALTAARAVADQDSRAWALGELAMCLHEPQRGEVLAEALTAARAITTEYLKVSILAMLVGSLPNPQRKLVMTEILDIARAVPSDAGPVARALAKLARYLPERFLTGALTAAYDAVATMNDWDLGRSEAVGKLARYACHVPAGLLGEALIATRALPIDYNVTPVLGVLALYLPKPQREQVLAEALTTARWTGFARRAALTQAAALWGPKVGSHELELVRRLLDAPGLDDCFSAGRSFSYPPQCGRRNGGRELPRRHPSSSALVASAVDERLRLTTVVRSFFLIRVPPPRT
ncbi:MAG: hypothetical protein ACRDRW_06800 [Pseudonocardiaceae bacterium]